jgi:hypothetical protein
MGLSPRKDRTKTRFVILRYRSYLGVNVRRKLQDNAVSIRLGNPAIDHLRRIRIIRAVKNRNFSETHKPQT